MMGVSVVFPHRPGEEQDKMLALNLRMLDKNTVGHYEVIRVDGGERHIVYPAFNFLISQAKYPIVVMSNTDVVFSPGWDEKLVRQINNADWFSFRLVECGQIGSEQIVEDFGIKAETFDENAFYSFVNSKAADYPEMEQGFTWYVPCAWRKDYFMRMGGFDTNEPFPYPNDINFRLKCQEAGCRFGIINSWAYHFQRAEVNRGERPER